MTNSEYSADPYQDGTVPADADLASPGADVAADEADAADREKADDGLVGATGDGEPNPDALVDGNRVATTKDME